MSTISILGSGWLGLPLAQHLLAAGHQVKLSTRTESRFVDLNASGAKAFMVDIDSPAENLAAFLDADILIINITSKNVEGFRQLAAAVEASPIQHLLFVSSTSVYQNVPKIVSESDVDLLVDSPLVEIEKLFRNLGNTTATILRFAGLIGYTRHPGRFFRSGKTVQNPDTPVNLIHRDDCIGIIQQIIEQQCWGEVLNGCTDSHPTKREFYSFAAEQAGQPVPSFAENGADAGKVVSNEKAKSLLGYRFKYPNLMDMIL